MVAAKAGAPDRLLPKRYGHLGVGQRKKAGERYRRCPQTFLVSGGGITVIPYMNVKLEA